jgi:hypothetical protein
MNRSSTPGLRPFAILFVVAIIAGLRPAAAAEAPWRVTASVVASGPIDGLPSSCTGMTNEAEPTLASEPGDTSHLVGIWSAGGKSGSNTSVAGVSRDGGATWTRTAIPATGGCTGGPGDFAIDEWAAVGVGGGAYFASLAGHEFGISDPSPLDWQALVSASASGGDTWAAASVIDDGVKGARGVVTRTSMTADPTQPGRAWAVWNRSVNPVFQAGIFVSRTDDGGGTWNSPVKAAADPPGGIATAWQLVARPDGGLVLFYGELGTVSTITTGPGLMDGPTLARAVRSDDGGSTWSAPSTVADIPAYILGRAAAAGDGGVYFVWNELDGDTASVLVARSDDGGITWSAPMTAAEFPAGQLGSRYVSPDVAVNAEGSIGVSYYDGTPGNGTITRSFAHSTDRGGTWAAQPIFASFAFDPGGTGNGDGPEGAYQGLAPAGEGFGALFIVTTGDATNPTDVEFVRVEP